ncbi:MAG: acetoin dehydrogenase dihydrolipoyllysine-residue acetyltransferase subunit [Albidovulum sp.]|nr:acetoin dehydrogenase dihydrolipoyllysine-residue acetyltransferase subunit [Albidovulum sp.]
MSEIRPIVMPKWGLAMAEGKVLEWQAGVGDVVSEGQEILDIETSKIVNSHESPVSGKIRRIVVDEGGTVPVGALLGVCAPETVSDAEIEDYVAEFLENFDWEAASEDSVAEPEFADTPVGRIRYLRQGNGEGAPIILVHGFGGDCMGWSFNQSELAEFRPAYAIDLPGHGGSEKNVGDGTVSYLARSLSAFLDAVGIRRAHLVGHSLGGAVSAALELESPGTAESISLIAPAGLGEDINIDFIDGFISQRRMRKLRAVLEMLVADSSLITDTMVEDVNKFKRLEGSAEALAALRNGAFSECRQQFRFEERLGAISAPVQVIWGRQDRILPVAHAESLPDGIRRLVLEDVGHMPHMESAGEVNDAILSFVR